MIFLDSQHKRHQACSSTTADTTSDTTSSRWRLSVVALVAMGGRGYGSRLHSEAGRPRSPSRVTLLMARGMPSKWTILTEWVYTWYYCTRHYLIVLVITQCFIIAIELLYRFVQVSSLCFFPQYTSCKILLPLPPFSDLENVIKLYSSFSQTATMILDDCDKALSLAGAADFGIKYACANQTRKTLPARCDLPTETCHRYEKF